MIDLTPEQKKAAAPILQVPASLVPPPTEQFVEGMTTPVTKPQSFIARAKSAVDQNAGAAEAIDPGAMSKPGAWSKALVSGFTDALGDASIGQVPKGAGALYGISAALRNRGERLAKQQEYADKLKQQQFENIQREKETGFKEKELTIKEKESQANIANANMQEYYHARAARNADQEFQKTALASSKDQMQLYLDEGAVIVAHGLSSDEIQERMKTGNHQAHELLHFVDGYSDVIGKDGNPVLDEAGNIKQRSTWTVLSDVPEVKLSKTQADFYNQFAPSPTGKYTEGATLSGSDNYLIQKRAQAAQGVSLSVAKTKSEISEHQTAEERNRAEIREKNQTSTDRARNVKTLGDLAAPLAAANGDEILMFSNLALNPKQADLLSRTEQLYGPGELAKRRESAVRDLTTTITEDSRELNNVINAPDKERAQDLQNEIRAAQQKRNSYLGLHPSDPPNIAEMKMRLDKISPDQRALQIAAMPSAQDRAYFYVVYKIPVPQSKQ